MFQQPHKREHDEDHRIDDRGSRNRQFSPIACSDGLGDDLRKYKDCKRKDCREHTDNRRTIYVIDERSNNRRSNSIGNSIKTKDIVAFLVAIPELESVAMRLYHYFKYFSQYEHFSENGQGDVLVSMEKDGNDNIHLPSAIRALSAGVEEVIKN